MTKALVIIKKEKCKKKELYLNINAAKNIDLEIPYEIQNQADFNKNNSIPLLDISCISLQHVDIAYKNYEELGKKLCEALSTYGFAYLQNHGIPERTVEECKAESKKFFDLTDEIKTKYR